MLRITLLPDLIVVLGVAAAALEMASALPTLEIRRMIHWLGRAHPTAPRLQR
jgi:hypothetical protein